MQKSSLSIYTVNAFVIQIKRVHTPSSRLGFILLMTLNTESGVLGYGQLYVEQYNIFYGSLFSFCGSPPSFPWITINLFVDVEI